MTESDVQSGGRTGPRWLQGGPRSALSAPAAVVAAPPTQFVGQTTEYGKAEDLFHTRYSRNAISPIPFGVVSIGLMIASFWAFDWSRISPEATDAIRSSEWWINITSLLLPGEDIRFGSYSQFRMWVTLAIMIATAASIALWIGRIGNNLRTINFPFGAFLPVLAFPAWWILPITVGITSSSNRSRSDLLLRSLVAFGILFAQFMLVRWPLLNRIWRAGHLPYDLMSILLWLPMMIPWAALFLSTAFTYISIGDDGTVADSSWRPTDTMLTMSRDASRITGVAILILLIVVSVAQQIGMSRDRADAAAARM